MHLTEPLLLVAAPGIEFTSVKEGGQEEREDNFLPAASNDSGIVNIEIGFAALKPTEFVIVRISQKTGQIST